MRAINKTNWMLPYQFFNADIVDIVGTKIIFNTTTYLIVLKI